MATLAMFKGIFIRMKPEKNVQAKKIRLLICMEEPPAVKARIILDLMFFIELQIYMQQTGTIKMPCVL